MTSEPYPVTLSEPLTPSNSASARVSHLCHRYVLPIAGACALTLGLLIVAGVWKGTVVALYWTLFAVGLAALVACFGYLAGQEAPSAPTPASDPIPVASKPTVPARTPPAPTRASEAARPRAGRPHSGLGRAVVSAANGSSDVLWNQWMPLKSGPLGVEAAGPIAESWYFASRSGAIAPYAGRDREAILLTPDPRTEPVRGPSTPAPVRYSSPRSGLPSVPKPRTEPFSDIELEAMFPSDEELAILGAHLAGSAVISNREPSERPPPPELPLAPPSATAEAARSESRPLAPATVAAWEYPAAGAVSEASSLVTGPAGSLASLDALDHQIYLESINPTPPHLRPAPQPAARPEPRAARSSPRAATGPSCAMCSRPLPDFRAWVECPHCDQPMCRDCLGISFMTGGEGRCFRCRDSHGPAAT